MSRQIEWLSAVLWAATGAAILAASWRMDRLADRGINPWSAPGVTPGVVGGRGLPFAVDSAIFIFSFTAVFSWKAWREQGRLARGIVQTAVVAVLAAGGMAWLFQSVFLVRLP